MPDLQQTTGLDDYTALTGGIGQQGAGKDEEEGTDTRIEPRRSHREKWTRGYQHEYEADENTNSDKLGVYAAEGMGYGLLLNKILVSRIDLYVYTTENTYYAEKLTPREPNPIT